MVSDAQTEGTFSILLLEQARTALNRLSVSRVVGCLSTSLVPNNNKGADAFGSMRRVTVSRSDVKFYCMKT